LITDHSLLLKLPLELIRRVERSSVGTSRDNQVLRHWVPKIRERMARQTTWGRNSNRLTRARIIKYRRRNRKRSRTMRAGS
jgi:hypothetical protein